MAIVIIICHHSTSIVIKVMSDKVDSVLSIYNILINVLFEISVH